MRLEGIQRCIVFELGVYDDVDVVGVEINLAIDGNFEMAGMRNTPERRQAGSHRLDINGGFDCEEHDVPDQLGLLMEI
jgi:hypothetical protein